MNIQKIQEQKLSSIATQSLAEKKPANNLKEELRGLKEELREVVSISETTSEQPEKPKTIKINYFPQDPLASQMETIEIPDEGISKGPATSRIKVSDGQNAPAEKDKEGNMLYLPIVPQFDQVESFVATDMALRLIERNLGRPVKWAFGREYLSVHPHARQMLNAYYSRWDGSTNFCGAEDPRLGKTIQAAQSAEVIAHETGHAILDGLRPSYLSSWSTVAGAFHESFADITAILVSLQDNNVIEKVLQETRGDLTDQNVVARLAEELARGIYDSQGIVFPNHDYLRNAINSLKDVKDPEKLPSNPPDENELGKEPHNYSRVFTGAFYDILTALHNVFKANGLSAKEALIKARDISGNLIARAIEFSPEGDLKSYAQIANAILKADETDYNKRYSNLIRNVFIKRNILTANDKQPEMEVNLPSFKIINKNNALQEIEKYLEDNRSLMKLEKDLPLKLEEIYQNKKGETFYRFSYTKEITLNGQKYGRFKGAVVELQGGIVLGFDSQDNLFFNHVNRIDQPLIEDIKSYIQELIKEDMIKYMPPFKKATYPEDFFKKTGKPYSGYAEYKEGKMKLERTKIIC